MTQSRKGIRLLPWLVGALLLPTGCSRESDPSPSSSSPADQEVHRKHLFKMVNPDPADTPRAGRQRARR